MYTFGNLIIVLIATSLVQVTRGDGVVSVLLKRFYNAYSSFENRTLCDSGFSNDAVHRDDCDNWFEICLKKYSFSHQIQPCEYYGKTYILGGDDFIFPANGKNIGINMTNPVLFKFKGQWPVSGFKSILLYRKSSIFGQCSVYEYRLTCKPWHLSCLRKEIRAQDTFFSCIVWLWRRCDFCVCEKQHVSLLYIWVSKLNTENLETLEWS